MVLTPPEVTLGKTTELACLEIYPSQLLGTSIDMLEPMWDHSAAESYPVLGSFVCCDFYPSIPEVNSVQNLIKGRTHFIMLLDKGRGNGCSKCL